MTIATAAPISVLTTFTNSFVSQANRVWRVAPIKLSNVVATNAATMQMTTPNGETMPTAQLTRAIAPDATTPASVPSRLTAPSVPRGTGFRVVIRKVRCPYALPTSLAQVSDSLVLKLAT